MLQFHPGNEAINPDLLLFTDEIDEDFVRSAERFLRVLDQHEPDALLPATTPRPSIHAIGAWVIHIAQHMLGLERVGIGLQGTTFRSLATLGVEEHTHWWKAMRSTAFWPDEQPPTRSQMVKPLPTSRLCLVLPLPGIPGEQVILAAEKRLGRTIADRERLLLTALLRLIAPSVAALTMPQTHSPLELLISHICHELNTPLTSSKLNIQVALQKLQQSLEDLPMDVPARWALQEAARMIAGAERQIKIETRLVNDLYELVHVGQQGMSLTLQPCDVMEVLRQVIESQRLAWPERTITLIGPPSMAMVADPERFAQVATNLLTNALKYAYPEQPIRVILTPLRRSVRVKVIDRGPGLTPEELQHIWTNYYRAGTSAKHIPGWGLGLAICRAIIESLKGEIGATSDQGVGSTFWFRLPLIPATKEMILARTA